MNKTSVVIFISFSLLTTSCKKQNYDYWYKKEINIESIYKQKKKKEIKVAVLDSGFNSEYSKYFHESYLEEEINLTEDYNNYNLHGTFVSLLISSIDFGVDSNLYLYPIKIIDSSGVTTKELVLKGLEKAKELSCDVINMSFGNTSFDTEVNNLINTFDSSVFLLSSVGDKQKDSFFFPSNYERVLAVSAVNKEFNLYEYSNTSSTKDSFLAPGEGLDFVINNTTIYKTGSSYACAIVSGIIASCLSRGILNTSAVTSFDVYNEAGRLDCSKFINI